MEDIQIVTNMCGFCQTPAITKCSRCKKVFYCNRQCQKSHWKVHKKSCAQIANSEQEPEPEAEPEPEVLDTSGLELRVEVRPSSVHGLGVFAISKIRSGDRVCYYDGDLKDARVRVQMLKLPSGELKIKNASEVFGTILESASEVDRCMAHPDPKWSMNVKIGRMDSEDKSGFGVGQFVNDSCKPEIDSNMDFADCSEELRKYQSKSLEKSNCEISGNNFWIEAYKDIEPGEELFIHYGFQFWLRKLLLGTESPDERFMYYALHDQSQQPFNLTRFFDYDDETCRIFLTDLIKMPENSVENYKDIKELLFELAMKVNRLDASALAI